MVEMMNQVIKMIVLKQNKRINHHLNMTQKDSKRNDTNNKQDNQENNTNKEQTNNQNPNDGEQRTSEKTNNKFKRKFIG